MDPFGRQGLPENGYIGGGRDGTCHPRGAREGRGRTLSTAAVSSVNLPLFATSEGQFDGGIILKFWRTSEVRGMRGRKVVRNILPRKPMRAVKALVAFDWPASRAMPLENSRLEHGLHLPHLQLIPLDLMEFCEASGGSGNRVPKALIPASSVATIPTSYNLQVSKERHRVDRQLLLMAGFTRSWL
ncbi:hypothetical protein E4U52_005651 [Claviceps spartinae]|nr:hypothetical protein E4U52_005651 [Claviceps spartinae]KAG6116309.1 hypothetical protein E4U14_000312 [Claviceps sp. LM454 group G7]